MTKKRRFSPKVVYAHAHYVKNYVKNTSSSKKKELKFVPLKNTRKKKKITE